MHSQSVVSRLSRARRTSARASHDSLESSHINITPGDSVAMVDGCCCCRCGAPLAPKGGPILKAVCVRNTMRPRPSRCSGHLRSGHASPSQTPTPIWLVSKASLASDTNQAALYCICVCVQVSNLRLSTHTNTSTSPERAGNNATGRSVSPSRASPTTN